MKRKWLISVSLVLVCCMLPLNALAGLYWGKIVRITARSAVNVYAWPERKNFVGEAMSTNTYDYLGKSGDWYHIQFTSDQDGYIPAKYAAIEDGLVWRSGAGEVDAVVRNTHYNTLNVRNAPSLKSSSIGELRSGDCLEYCGTENGWNRVYYQGSYAYVAANRTTIEVVGASSGVDSTAGSTR